jgi:uncharacterized surface protein with fasciclin (FAS1) repeats
MWLSSLEAWPAGCCVLRRSPFSGKAAYYPPTRQHRNTTTTTGNQNMMSARVSSLLACLALGAAVPAVPADRYPCHRTEGQPTCNVLELLAAIPEVSTFVRALKAAGTKFTNGSVEAGNLTIFAPTNDAFGALPPGRLEGLLDPNNIDELRAVLTYHIVDPDPAGSPLGPIFAKDLKEGEVKTQEGESVYIRLDLASAASSLRPNGAIFVDRARVVKADLAASDGVIHTVSGVLEPLGLNHLYFRYLTGEYNCGQVDAGPRMPASIFDKENAMALQAVSQLSSPPPPPPPPPPHTPPMT